MQTLAVVSKLNPDQLAQLRALCGPDWTVLDCSDERERLAAEGAGVVIAYGNVRPQEIAALPKLRWVHATWTGVENLLYPAMRSHGAVITNTRGQSSKQIAEHVLGCLMHMTRGLGAFQRSTALGLWKPEIELRLVEGSRALVLGLGALGGVVAKKLSAVGVRVWGMNRGGKPAEGCEETFTPETVRAKLGEVDHVVACLPNVDSARKIVDDRFLAALKPGATLINVGRGAAVDEAALVRHLRSGHLSGAVLDVTDPEPPEGGSPLFQTPNLLLTSHMSWFPFAEHTVAWEQFLTNLKLFLAGRNAEFINVVDKNAGY